jgi:hypothetical protein
MVPVLRMVSVPTLVDDATIDGELWQSLSPMGARQGG